MNANQRQSFLAKIDAISDDRILLLERDFLLNGALFQLPVNYFLNNATATLRFQVNTGPVTARRLANMPNGNGPLALHDLLLGLSDLFDFMVQINGALTARTSVYLEKRGDANSAACNLNPTDTLVLVCSTVTPIQQHGWPVVEINLGNSTGRDVSDFILNR